jgi:murein DD-endopeptidase MepM/ murein hydrolase activator NlpD
LTSIQAIRNILRNVPSPEILAAAGNNKPKDLLWPVVKGTWGRGFGFTRKLRPELHHNGIDIGAPQGAPVRASADGIVIYSDNELEGYGNCVIIVHPNGWVTLYAHNLRNTVQPGWRVKRGERIALIGSTGASWGPHLHYELRRWGNLLDPAPYLRGNRSMELNGVMVDLPEQVSLPTETIAKADNDTEETKSETPNTPLEKLTAGSERTVERFLRRAPSEEEFEAVQGRVPEDLLWPVRGGGEIVAQKGKRKPRSIAIEAQAGVPVRAAADGVVIWSGDELNKYGKSVVLLHRNGWVTVYGAVDNTKFKPGDQVKRGTWIGRTETVETQSLSRLRFELRQNGKAVDPTALLVKLPVDTGVKVEASNKLASASL